MDDFSIQFTVIVTDSSGNTITEIPSRKFSDEAIYLICEDVAKILNSEE